LTTFRSRVYYSWGREAREAREREPGEGAKMDQGCRKCGNLATGPEGLCWKCEEEALSSWEREYQEEQDEDQDE
jgi:uncharacterized OB-fold protein